MMNLKIIKKTLLIFLIILCISATFNVSSLSLSNQESKIETFKNQLLPNTHSTESDSWEIETVNDIGDIGWYSSIELFENDIFISCYDLENGDLRLVFGINQIWSQEIVDEKGDVGMYSSLAIDSEGIIHISYYDRTSGNLKYAKKTQDNWQFEIIDEVGDTGLDTSISIDTSDHIHISYYDKTNGNLKYATKKETSWKIEIVDANGNIGCGTSIATDKSNTVHISYTDNDQGFLWYATNTDSEWTITCVDDESLVYGSTALSLDSSGSPHICYYDVPNPTEDWSLKYATKQDQKWIKEIIDPDLKYFWNEWGCSIAIDSFDRVHVGYYAWNKWNANYALKSNNNWITEVVESEGSVGGYASITVNESGYPYMSYMNMNEVSLKFAKKINFSPETPNTPQGKKIGLKGKTYSFETKTIDFDKDTISYGWKWDDESNIEWTAFQRSNTSIKMNHTWDTAGKHTIQVKARDENGFESSWSDSLTVIMIKSKEVQYPILNFMKINQKGLLDYGFLQIFQINNN